MNYTEQLEELRKSLSIKKDKKGLKHTINKKSPILPFQTRNPERAKFAEGFSGVTGEFSRIINGNALDKDVEMESVIKDITEKVKPAEEDIPFFVRLIRMFVSEDMKTMKVFHPHMFQYIPLTAGDESKGEANIALFIRDVLMEEDKLIEKFFGKDESDHLVAKLILNHMDHLRPSEKSVRYQGMLPTITEVFKEDIAYLAKHKEYFIENIHLFLAYYYFFYITQLTLKLNQSKKDGAYKVSEIVYTLDWESSSKSRIGYQRGYQLIKDASKHILTHVNCLEQLNFIFGTTSAKDYNELRDELDTLEEEQKSELFDAIQTWIEEYRYHVSLPSMNFVVKDYESLVSYLYQSLDEGLSAETKSRYALSVEEVGKRYFLKTRGILGYMLNISQDFLLLLTTISVKDERKSLKDVFREFERRGIFLDRHSREAVVQLFDKLNILDKKSDSGDAQYVKPIL
ncbi:DNA phosphorothioation-dependent restriction protein DptG [Terribacillus halophilus]|jgi:DNA phosphorothioation-dependent restriction protein DptG|uniref:DNA phosphorothioation-dependent restriction protein DptG n=1 Tax=Terribacillus halophilus TaxID=361279 RepID=UPI000987AFE4|nr:DNA phosphorothioation-dependent restriction protein DptG [Terribacillus halophilus]